MRGRRVAAVPQKNLAATRLVVFLIALSVVGVAAVMYLSALTTDQSFRIRDAKQTSAQLSNQLESLERSVSEAQSAGRLSERAAQLGMVVPNQPGILDARGKDVVELRPNDPQGNRAIVDVNGQEQSRAATSNPAETARVPGLAPRDPAGLVAAPGVSGTPAGANLPYSGAATGGGAAPQPAPASPAPAPAAAPAPAPVPAGAPAPANAAPAPAPAAPAPAQPAPPRIP